jgi:predicted SnoaL-like aldol condensation-catalyzing enzyme
MKNFKVRGIALLVGSAAAFVLMAGSAVAQKLDANAQFCDDFDQTVIVQGKLDQASKYLTDDFVEHNVRMLASGLGPFVEKMKAFQAANAARGGGGRGRGRGGPAPVKTVFSHDDVVVFISVTPERDDPANAGQKLPPSTHFDVYKLRGGKISEHWD